jgi:hypothetical protein
MDLCCQEPKTERVYLPRTDLCTYCTHLADFCKDDMSPWLVYSIHIQHCIPSSETPLVFWVLGEPIFRLTSFKKLHSSYLLHNLYKAYIRIEKLYFV